MGIRSLMTFLKAFARECMIEVSPSMIKAFDVIFIDVANVRNNKLLEIFEFVKPLQQVVMVLDHTREAQDAKQTITTLLTNSAYHNVKITVLVQDHSDCGEADSLIVSLLNSMHSTINAEKKLPRFLIVSGDTDLIMGGFNSVACKHTYCLLPSASPDSGYYYRNWTFVALPSFAQVIIQRLQSGSDLRMQDRYDLTAVSVLFMGNDYQPGLLGELPSFKQLEAPWSKYFQLRKKQFKNETLVQLEECSEVRLSFNMPFLLSILEDYAISNEEADGSKVEKIGDHLISCLWNVAVYLYGHQFGGSPFYSKKVSYAPPSMSALVAAVRVMVQDGTQANWPVDKSKQCSFTATGDQYWFSTTSTEPTTTTKKKRKKGATTTTTTVDETVTNQDVPHSGKICKKVVKFHHTWSFTPLKLQQVSASLNWLPTMQHQSRGRGRLVLSQASVEDEQKRTQLMSSLTSKLYGGVIPTTATTTTMTEEQEQDSEVESEHETMHREVKQAAKLKRMATKRRYKVKKLLKKQKRDEALVKAQEKDDERKKKEEDRKGNDPKEARKQRKMIALKKATKRRGEPISHEGTRKYRKTSSTSKQKVGKRKRTSK